jgi:hypothetical protein
MDYRSVCFVIMPFETKKVAFEKGESRDVNFDEIYEDIFKPAIEQVPLPEGGTLQPRRVGFLHEQHQPGDVQLHRVRPHRAG